MMIKLRIMFVVLTATVILTGCSSNPAAGEPRSSTPSTPSRLTSTPSATPTVASLLPAGIRTDGFYKQNSASGYDALFQFNADGTVSGLYTVVDTNDLAKYKPGSGNLRKYWLNTPASNGDPQTPQEYGPNVLGVTRIPLGADLTVGYRTPSQGPVIYKILSVSENSIRISETSDGGVLTSDWTFTEY